MRTGVSRSLVGNAGEFGPMSFRRPSLAVFVTSILLAVPLLAGAQVPESVPMRDPSSITVSGSGEASAVPDEARILFWVETRAETATGAARENARLQEAV